MCVSFVCAGMQNSANFEDDIAPLISRLSCNSTQCHGSEVGAGGLRLSMFAGDNEADCEALSKNNKFRLADLKNPKNSLLLKKLSGKIPHSGKIFDENSAEYKAFENWIASGCKFRNEGAPKLVSIICETPELVIPKGEDFQLKFYGVYDDNSKKDFTKIVSLYTPNGQIELKDSSKIYAKNFGPTYINASAYRKFCTVSVLVAKEPLKNFPEEEPNNKIDIFISKNLMSANILPSAICSDSEFMRRLYLDATGLLPSPKEVEAFIFDKGKNKREKLIDKVVASPEFTDKLAMRFSDLLRIKSEFPSNLWPNAAQAYHTWLRDAFDSGMPYDIIARRMLLSSGSNFKNPPVNFYRAVNVKNADNFAEAASLVFMGVRTNCIKCHVHPQEEWTIKDSAAMASIFSQLKFKNSKEWKEEILALNLPDTNEKSEPIENFVLGEKILSPAGRDTREAFVDWLLDDSNRYFARAAMSRVWYWIFGIGLIEPADDIRPNRPPTNPELLAYLEEMFKASDYDFRKIYKLIFMSKTYQRSYKTNASNADDTLLFSHRIPTRLEAESLNDIISGVLGEYQAFKSITPEPYSFWPENFKAHQLHDGSVSNPFLTLFGKPGRNSSYLNDRSNLVSMQQILHLSDSANINSKLNSSAFLKELAKGSVSNEEKIKTLYLSFLTRLPSTKELHTAIKYLETSKTNYEGVKDLAWAIINTKEFLFKL